MSDTIEWASTDNGLVVVDDVTDAMIDRAKRHTKRRDKRYQSGADFVSETWVGCLTERVFYQWLKDNCVSHELHDVSDRGNVDFQIHRTRVELKSFVAATVESVVPRGWVAVPASCFGRADEYVFATYTRTNRVIILGGIDRATFRQHARFVAHGDVVRSGWIVQHPDGDFVVRSRRLVRPAKWLTRILDKQTDDDRSRERVL